MFVPGLGAREEEYSGAWQGASAGQSISYQTSVVVYAGETDTTLTSNRGIK